MSLESRRIFVENTGHRRFGQRSHVLSGQSRQHMESHGVFRPALDSSAIAFRCFPEVAFVMESATQIFMGLDVVGANGERPATKGDRLFKSELVQQQCADIAMHIAIIWI